MYITTRTKTSNPSVPLWHYTDRLAETTRLHTQMCMPANQDTERKTHRDGTCMAGLRNVFFFGRIYDDKQRVMKTREIFTVSVKAYYAGEENGVN